MDKLKFKTTIVKIQNTMKYVKEYEEVIRYTCTDRFDAHHKITIEKEYEYRVVMCAFKRFKEKSIKQLPDYVYRWIERRGTAILHEWFETRTIPEHVTYTHFINIFTDTEFVTLPRTHGIVILNMAELILDRDIPFSFSDENFTLEGSDAYFADNRFVQQSYSTRPLSNEQRPIVAMIMFLESMLKHTKHPDKSKYKIIHALLDDAYSRVPVKLDIPTLYDEIEYRAKNTLDLMPKIYNRMISVQEEKESNGLQIKKSSCL